MKILNNLKNLRKDSGQVLVITAVSGLVLLGFVALAVDVGALFHEQRTLQIVADAGATAGALDYYKGASTSNAETAAENAVGSNGLSIASGNWTTSCPGTNPGGATPVSYGCVATPPSTGVHQNTGFVEVQVNQPNRTTFMGMFGFNNLFVNTRAVAGPTVGQECVYVKNTFTVQANTGMCGVNPSNPSSWSGTCRSGSTCPSSTDIPACGVYAGSLTGTGNSNCVDSVYVETHAESTGGSLQLNPSPAALGVPSQDAPAWASASPPSTSTCSSWNPGVTGTYVAGHGNTPNTINATLTGTASSGCYGVDGGLNGGSLPGGWTASNTIMNLTISSAQLGSGTYKFDLGTTSAGGTLNIGSSVCNSVFASDNGNTCAPTGAPVIPSTTDLATGGLTLDIQTGNFSIASTSNNVYLFAPEYATASQNGILIWEPSSNTGTINIQWGAGNGDFYGYIVALGATVTMQDHGGTAMVSGLYVGNLTLNSDLGILNYASKVATAPGKTIALVE